MKRLIIIITGMVICAAAGYWWFNTTPRFALWKIATSIKQENWEGFNAYVDVNRLTQNAATDMVGMASKSMDKSEASSIVTKGLKALVSIKIKRALNDGLESWVRGEYTEKDHAKKGILSALLAAPTGSKGTDKPDNSPDTLGLESISRDKNHATAVICINNGQRLTLEMIKTGSSWKVIRLANLKDLLKDSSEKNSK
ncbi:MAG: DUF2939 domain-containing protein [Thermodesulfobacteriota bacterium]|nr:DUF2939 domain-containing protein [Thermodesulfobacteriota bacterium]